MQTMFVIVLTIILLLLGILAMTFRVLLIKGGKFPEGHAHDLEKLTKRNNSKKE